MNRSSWDGEPMRAGKLKHRIVIEQNNPTLDGLGGTVDNWTVFATRWAQKIEQSTRERFTAQQDVAEGTVTWRTRWLAGVTPLMRVNVDGTLYDIQGTTELGWKRGLDIHCVARTG